MLWCFKLVSFSKKHSARLYIDWRLGVQISSGIHFDTLSTEGRVTIQDPRLKACLGSWLDLLLRFEAAPAVSGVERPGCAALGLRAGLLTLRSVDIEALPDWLPLVPGEVGVL